MDFSIVKDDKYGGQAGGHPGRRPGGPGPHPGGHVLRTHMPLATAVNNRDTLQCARWGLGCGQRAGGDLIGAVVSLRLSLDTIAARRQVLRTDEGQVIFPDSGQDVFDQMAIHLERACADASGAQQALVVAALRPVFVQPHRAAAGQSLAVVVRAVELRWPKAAQPLHQA
jgi:hypothetical protein